MNSIEPWRSARCTDAIAAPNFSSVKKQRLFAAPEKAIDSTEWEIVQALTYYEIFENCEILTEET